MDLATNYLGLSLRNPFVVGASPFCDDVDVARKLQDAGAAAVVMRSVFEEQIEARREPAFSPSPFVQAQGAHGDPGFSEFAGYQLTPEEYVRQIDDLKKQLTIPVIASLNGRGLGNWAGFAARLERAGADAIELNCYHVVTDPHIAADQVENEILQALGALTSSVRIPVAVKLSPFHASVAQLAVALELAGASGIVVFDRFYQPDVSTEDIEVQPSLRLSESSELLLRLRWLAILSPLLRGSLSASGAIHTPADVVKALLTGADTVQLVSVLLQHGPQILVTLRKGFELWMQAHDYSETGQFRGQLNLQRCRNPAAFERANYIRALQSWKI